MIRRVRDAALLATTLLPLVVAKGLINPFLTPREAAYRWVLAVALPLAAFSMVRLRRPAALGASVIALVAVSASATAFSVDVANSFWGNPERLTGFLDIVLAVGYGAALAQAFADARFRARFLTLWTAVWAVVVLWALLEKALPGFWAQFNGGGARSVATIGNALFLAHGLILALPPAAAFLWSRWPGRRGPLAAGGAVLLALAAILATGTRGAFLGVMAGAAVAAVAYAGWSPRRTARAAAVAVPVAGVLLLAAIFTFREAPWLARLPVVGRAVSVFQADASTVQRLQLWGVALTAVRERPLLGWGPENFDAALDRHYDPAITGYGVTQSFSDRAHNGLLDVAAAFGLLGVAAYLSFLAALAWRIVRARRQGAVPAPAAAALLGGLAAYLAALFTAFDSQITLMGLAVYAAFVASLRPAAQEASERRVPAWVPAAAVGLGMLVAAGSVVPLVRGARLAHVAVVAPADADLRAPAEGIAAFANPYRTLQEQRIANEIFKRVGNAPAWLPAHADQLRAAEALMRDAVSRRPGSFGARFTLANIVLLQAANGQRPLEDAARLYGEARTLSPRRQMVDFQLGNLELIRGDAAAAVAAFERALALEPSVAEGYWHLGRGLAAAGETARAAEAFREALGRGFDEPRPREEDAVAINVLVEAGDLETVRDIYRARSGSAPDDADILAALAAVHAALGEREEAVAALLRALELDPTIRAEAEAFLRQNGYPEDVLPPL